MTAKWNMPPYVLVRRDRDGDWHWEARDSSNRMLEHSNKPHRSMHGAERAAKKVAAKRAWPVCILPIVNQPATRSP